MQNIQENMQSWTKSNKTKKEKVATGKDTKEVEDKDVVVTKYSVRLEKKNHIKSFVEDYLKNVNG